MSKLRSLTSSLVISDCGIGHELDAIMEREGDWFLAYAVEIPGANGQGYTAAEAFESLRDAKALIIEDRREDAAGPLLRHPFGR